MDVFNDFGFGRTQIAHYYGDQVRTLFIAAAVAIIIGDAIFGGYLLPLSLPAQIGAIILLVLLAALTSPHGRVVMLLNAIVSALGICAIELLAVSYHTQEPTIMLLLQEFVALLLLFALYYSIKTLRAFARGLIGHYAPQGEFDEK